MRVSGKKIDRPLQPVNLLSRTAQPLPSSLGNSPYFLCKMNHKTSCRNVRNGENGDHETAANTYSGFQRDSFNRH